MHLAFRRFSWATDFIWHSSDRLQPSRPRTTPVDTKCRVLRFPRCATSTSENPSASWPGWLCIGTEWRGFGERTKVRKSSSRRTTRPQIIIACHICSFVAPRAVLPNNSQENKECLLNRHVTTTSRREIPS
jgi:hypothetical protein